MSAEESIFSKAKDLPSEQRLAFLDKSCRGDEALKQRIIKLLEAHENTCSIIDRVVPESHSDPASDGLTTDQADNMLGKTIDKFKLLQKIGEGGFGAVYMAEQKEPVNRKVAVKIVKPGMDSTAVIARFEAERQALAILDHPNIAKVFDGGATHENSGTVTSVRPYFVMELVSGVPITEYCDQNQLSTTERLKLFQDVCQAVYHAHQKGIIHRDIKPSNVMVTLHDGQPVVKVIDFGIAKALNQKLTEKTMFTAYGQMIGTPQYMSPEQAEMSGLDVDTRSDIYSLAVLLYELLTGSTPLEMDSIREAGFQKMQELICNSEPLKPSLRISTSGPKTATLAKQRKASPEKLSREVRGDLDWIVMKGLEKDRRRRYETPRQFAEDIERAKRNEPVLAGPPSVFYRTRKWLQRNRAKSYAMVLMAVVAGVLLMAYANNLKQQRNDSDLLTQAVNEASRSLGIASQSAFNSPAWIEAEAAKKRIQDLLATSNPDPESRALAFLLLGEYEVAEFDRDFSTRLENILIQRATMMDLESWYRMERELKQILKTWDLDIDKLSANEVAEKAKKHHAKEKIADALELWVGTRAQMQSMGGPKVNQAMMQPWADAIYVIDQDPQRTGIRKIIYREIPATPENVNRLMADHDLKQASPRTLSWLGSALYMANQYDRANEIMRMALRIYPDDLMLNYDHALLLASQKKWNESIRYYMRCLAIRPKNAGCWHGLGIAYRENGELEQSIESLTYSIQLDGKVASTWIELAKSQLAEGMSESVIESARNGISLNPDLLQGWKLIGQARMKQERYQDALNAFAKSQRDPASARPNIDVSELVDACRKALDQEAIEKEVD